MQNSIVKNKKIQVTIDKNEGSVKTRQLAAMNIAAQKSNLQIEI